MVTEETKRRRARTRTPTPPAAENEPETFNGNGEADFIAGYLARHGFDFERKPFDAGGNDL
ncbi:MAG: hypothetical protein E7422_04635 [Ruminococcaceae bacterium]|nr:hypothetical protein [Oscillospiraceae bacterium]